jgi:hypothetical protein
MKSSLVIRLTPIERKRLEALAESWGVSLSGAVRRLIRENVEGIPSPSGVLNASKFTLENLTLADFEALTVTAVDDRIEIKIACGTTQTDPDKTKRVEP